MSKDTALRFGAFAVTNRYPGQSDAQVLNRALAAVDAAEQAGFDDIWITEHHFNDYGVNPSGLTFAANILGRTKRMRVGTAVTILPLHSPVHTAEQVALLDHVSGGRFDLGVGRAEPVLDYEAIGHGVEYWQRGLAESLDLLLQSFGGKVSSDTDLYRFREVRPQPRPLTTPHPPVYVASNSQSSLELAARQGLPMLLFYDKNDVTKAEMVARHSELAAAAGHPRDGYDHAFAVFTQVNDTVAEAQHLVRDVTMPALAAAQADYHHLIETKTHFEPEAFIGRFGSYVLGNHPVGTPDMCIERLVRSIRVSGCRRVLCEVLASGDDEGTLTNIRRLGAEVLPEVRARLAGD
ncbi:LLM class flavin-dependent oxidoreductase [Amycolatopsis sp. NPDC059027]|uniref:LLM class flavin-dependent oxidoreductase n=1 Tax=unclassified Amycolatopsis TaxID=2618356 RepID=UPI00366BE1C0